MTEALSKREGEVARLAACAMTSREIAERLCVNVRTVEGHLSAIYRKLGLSNRAGLVAFVTSGQLDDPAPAAVARPTRRLGPRGPFVGRRDVLDRIAAIAQESLSGSTRLVLVAGEPGAGKSALLRTALDALGRDRSTLVLVGRCIEGLRSPFGAIVEAIGGYLATVDGRLDDLVGPTGGVLATLMPTLADRVPAVPESLDAAARPRMVAEALRHALVTAANAKPVILVLDDLHWADPTGFAFLQALVAEPPDVPLLVLTAFRDSEAILTDDSSLATFIAQVEVRPPVERIDLDGLDHHDTLELFGVLGGGQPDESTIATLRASTAGNALYLTTLVRDLVAGASMDELPPSLHAAIRLRLDRLGMAERSVLELAAVLGLDSDLDVLAVAQRIEKQDQDHGVGSADVDLGRVDLGRVEQAVDTGIAAGILTESGADGADVRFVHDVVRQSVLGEIRSRRLATLHGIVGSALAVMSNDVPTLWLTIADHLARSDRKADRIRAADFVHRLFGTDLASLALDDAFAVADRILAALPAGSESDWWRLKVLTDLIDVHYLRVDHDAHRATVIEAAHLAERIGAPIDLAEVLTHYRLLPITGTVDVGILALVDDARAALPREGRNPLRLRALLGGYAAYHRAIGGAGFTVDAEAEAALAEARSSGDPSSVAAVLYNLAGVLLGSPKVGRLREALDEFDRFSGPIPGIIDRHDGLRLAGCAALQTGDRAAFERFAARLTRRAERSQSGFLGGVSVMWKSLSALLDGDLDRASAANDELLPLAAPDPNVLLGWFVQHVAIGCAQGRLAEMIDLAESTLAEHPDLVALQALASWVAFEVGDLDRSWEIAGMLARNRFRTVANDWTLAASLTWFTPVVLLRGSDDEVRALGERLTPYSGQLVLVGSASDVLGAADRALGLLTARLGDIERALVLLEDAATLEDQAGARLLAATTRLATANVLAARGTHNDLDQARRLAATVVAEAATRGWVSLCEQAGSPRYH